MTQSQEPPIRRIRHGRVLWTVIGLLSICGSFFKPLSLFAEAQPHLCILYLTTGLLSIRRSSSRLYGSLWMLIGLAHLVILGPFLFPKETEQGTHNSDTGITVMVYNQHANNTRFDLSVPMIAEALPDILIICEANNHLLDRLTHLHPHYPTRLEAGRWTRSTLFQSSGTILWSRFPASESAIIPLENAHVQIIRACLDTGTNTIEVVAAHPPSPRSFKGWTQQRLVLRDIGSHLTGKYPTLLAGDLNTTVHSAVFRALEQSTRLRSTSRQQGLRITWPAFLFPAGIGIDHILTSPDIRCSMLQTFPSAGSDHRPIVATLHLPTMAQAKGASPTP